MKISVYIDITRVKAIIVQSLRKCLTPYYSRVSYNIPYIGGFIAYLSLGIGSCFGGLSLNYFNNKFITSETGRACSSPILSRNFLIDSVVRKATNSERFSFISFTMLNILCLFIKYNNVKLC